MNNGQGARWLAGAPAAPEGDYDADIIILALDREEETLAAIGSALSQTGVSRHVFVLDQGSRQQSRDRFAAAVADRRDATLLAASCNLGVAGGRNLVTSQGHGRAIIALDNDAVFATPDTVARMVSALDAEPRLAAVGCRIVAHDTGADDLSSWGYPASLLPSAGTPLTPSPMSAPATRCGAQPGRSQAATTQSCFSAGRSSTSACAPSPLAGVCGIAAIW